MPGIVDYHYMGITGPPLWNIEGCILFVPWWQFCLLTGPATFCFLLYDVGLVDDSCLVYDSCDRYQQLFSTMQSFVLLSLCLQFLLLLC